MAIKQVIVVNKALKMRAGKMAAQVAHAAMAFLTSQFNDQLTDPADNRCGKQVVHAAISNTQREWVRGSYRKIVAYVESHEELLKIIEQAQDAGVASYPIIDAGLTEFKEPTMTCVALGPDEDQRLDPITGGLKLL